jgi:hypothetical protein
MMSGFEVTCANRTPGGRIIRVGGNGWSYENHEAILKILTQQIRLRIRVDDQFREVGVRGSGTHAYLALEPDGYPLHDLKSLPSC